MLPGYEAGRSQALVKAEGEVTLKETCQLLRLRIDLVKSIHKQFVHGNCLIEKCRDHFYAPQRRKHIVALCLFIRLSDGTVPYLANNFKTTVGI